ncbi:MAG: hypothetical protein JSR32_00210 [Proteobacteria bacterium]|nr:hypothetical protein [Pseudomonadota bacterium]
MANSIEVLRISFSEYDVTRCTRKGNFLKQIDQLKVSYLITALSFSELTGGLGNDDSGNT